MMRQEKILAFLLMGMLLISVALADPIGGTLTPGTSSRGTDPTATTQEAQAGNVTQLNIDQTRITDIWQGFYGNVSGQIVLENAAGNNFYDWTSATVSGEVYASRATISSWAGIACTNSTQWEAEETTLNIPSTATDGINETYSSTSHTGFDVGTIPISNCRSTRPYNSTGLPGDFWNVMLNSDASNVVYAAVLADDSDAFEGGTTDFELLVPTDKSSGTATYYFYVELD